MFEGCQKYFFYRSSKIISINKKKILFVLQNSGVKGWIFAVDGSGRLIFDKVGGGSCEKRFDDRASESAGLTALD